MTPKRLSVGPLSEEFSADLRNLTVNARNNNLDPNGDMKKIEAPFTGETISWVGKGT